MLSGADQLHLTAGYILYNYVCDKIKILNLEKFCWKGVTAQ